VVQALGEQIVQGRFQPGDVIETEVIEGELGVSRTVVREAIRALAEKGLVAARPKRGTFILSRNDWNLLDPDILAWHSSSSNSASSAFLRHLEEVRQIFEPRIARLAAARRSQADIKNMKSAVTAMRDASNGSGMADLCAAADVDFHHALLIAAHNELLTQLGPLLEHALKQRDAMVFARMGPSDKSFVAAHIAVFDAIQDQDADRAEAAVLSLLKESVADVEQILADSGSATEDSAGP
jgi:GntR family transcriptional regulator, galactonate operon transcriptional repressor